MTMMMMMCGLGLGQVRGKGGERGGGIVEQGGWIQRSAWVIGVMVQSS